MISARNRPVPLNGNKFLAYLVLPLLLISCGAFKKSSTIEWPKDDEIVVVNPSNEKPKTPTTDTKDEKDDQTEKRGYSSVWFKGERYKVPVHDKSFDINQYL